MTASKYIKAQGLPTLAYVAEAVNKPPQTLNNWYKHNIDMFKIVVEGVVFTDMKQAALNHFALTDMEEIEISFKRINP